MVAVFGVASAVAAVAAAALLVPAELSCKARPARMDVKLVGIIVRSCKMGEAGEDICMKEGGRHLIGQHGFARSIKVCLIMLVSAQKRSGLCEDHALHRYWPTPPRQATCYAHLPSLSFNTDAAKRIG